MLWFKKKNTYTPPNYNDRPVDVRFNIENNPYADGEATIKVDSCLYNQYGAAIGWAAFPTYYDYTKGEIEVINTPFGHYFKENSRPAKSRVTLIESNSYTHGLPDCSGKVAGFILPEKVITVGRHLFTQTNVSIIVPDSLFVVENNALSEYRGEHSYKIFDRIANYYEGAYYFGNERNPYHVLICANHNAERCIIHPNTRIIQDGAFSDMAVASYRKFDHINSLVIPKSVGYIGRQNGSSYIKNVEFEDPNGWYEFADNDYRCGSSIWGKPTALNFYDGLRKRIGG